MKTIVYFYSSKGNNRFLAQKIATDLNCEIEEIKPRLNNLALMIMGVNLGNLPLKSKVEDYDKVIVCGPIWMGKLIVPLKNFVTKYKDKINKLIFVTCCGSSYEQKDEKFGHNHVFTAIKELAGDKCKHCEALPIGLVMTEEQKKGPESVISHRLTPDNFKGEIVGIYNALIQKIEKL